MLINVQLTDLAVDKKDKSIPLLSHPLYLAESFSPNPAKVNPHEFNVTIAGLAKLLDYGAFLRARAFEEGKNASELVMEEVEKYPYRRRNRFQVIEALP